MTQTLGERSVGFMAASRDGTSQIPHEFLPQVKRRESCALDGGGGGGDDDDDDDDSIEDSHIGNLFRNEGSCNDNDDDDYNDEDGHLEPVEIAGRTYRLRLPPDVGTLFAHRVWSGSRLLALYLTENPCLVRDKRTVEFGSGTALPSLVALSLGSSMSAITDYPDERIMRALRETVGYNWDACGDVGRVVVVGHEWGMRCDDVMDAASAAARAGGAGGKNVVGPLSSPSLSSSSLTTTTTTTSKVDAGLAEAREDSTRGIAVEPYYFDVAILSECLWLHRAHESLAKSVNDLIHPERGLVILTYAHHIPGKEKEDDAFFALCSERYGFVTEHIRTESMSYMWDDSKSIDVNLKVMRRRPR